MDNTQSGRVRNRKRTTPSTAQAKRVPAERPCSRGQVRPPRIHPISRNREHRDRQRRGAIEASARPTEASAPGTHTSCQSGAERGGRGD